METKVLAIISLTLCISGLLIYLAYRQFYRDYKNTIRYYKATELGEVDPIRQEMESLIIKYSELADTYGTKTKEDISELTLLRLELVRLGRELGQKKGNSNLSSTNTSFIR